MEAGKIRSPAVLVLTHLDRDTHTDSTVEVFSESVTEMTRKCVYSGASIM